MKTCFKCGRRLSPEQFYKHSEMSDGRLGKCKECTRADVRQNYHMKRERYLEYERSRAGLPHRVVARKAWAQTPAGKAAGRRNNAKYRRRYPQKSLARTALGNAIRDGHIQRQPCERCGAVKSHGHHEDYSRPFDVIWLCDKHHKERHRELKGRS